MFNCGVGSIYMGFRGVFCGNCGVIRPFLFLDYGFSRIARSFLLPAAMVNPDVTKTDKSSEFKAAASSSSSRPATKEKKKRKKNIAARYLFRIVGS